MHKRISIAFLASAITFGALAATATVKPKITMAQARATALKKAPGKVTSEELETEHGKLIYSFDIHEAGRHDVTEVNVDAMNGQIVAIDHENARKEAAEKKQEAKEKSPAKH